ncbi:uncharacterized protein ACO6RY_06822 [Pungitius sinensis]
MQGKNQGQLEGGTHPDHQVRTCHFLLLADFLGKAHLDKAQGELLGQKEMDQGLQVAGLELLREGTAQGTARGAARGIGRETGRGAARVAGRGTGRGAAQGTARGTAQVAARGIAQVAAQGTALGTAQVAARGLLGWKETALELLGQVGIVQMGIVQVSQDQGQSHQVLKEVPGIALVLQGQKDMGTALVPLGQMIHQQSYPGRRAGWELLGLHRAILDLQKVDGYWQEQLG